MSAPTNNPTPSIPTPWTPLWISLSPQQQRQIALALAEILRKHLAAAQTTLPEARDAHKS
jgi:hypothetical protein